MSWLFLGPQPFSGIGFVNKKYCDLVGGDYCEFGGPLPQKTYDNCFCFILPIDFHLNYAEKVAKKCKNMHYMTVCETETVHESYEKLLSLKPMFAPSEFAKNILERQFPTMNISVLRHFTPTPDISVPNMDSVYTFYTIGNIMDPRKNIQGLLRAFAMVQTRVGEDKVRLVLKATCKQPVSINQKGVMVLNGIFDEQTMNKIHNSCHCYVNCSHSEGVGMGAVEAALRNKPVIITDYGGLKEYVKTPFVVNCKLGEVGINDFLFTKEMKWGHFKLKDLVDAMYECYSTNTRTWDHAHTLAIMPTRDAFCKTCHM